MKPNLIEKHNNPQQGNLIEQSYEALKQNSEYIKGFSKWDNDVERGEKPILIKSYNLQGNYIELVRREGDVEHEQSREQLQPAGIHTVSRDLRKSGGIIRSINAVYDEKQNDTEFNATNRTIKNNEDVLQSRGSGNTRREDTTRDSGNGFIGDVELDREKIEREGKYNPDDLEHFIDDVFARRNI